MAETKTKKEKTKVEEKIDGQINIEDTAELKAVEETADIVKLEMPDGEQVEVDKENVVDRTAEINIRKQLGLDPDTVVNTIIETEDGMIIRVDINDYAVKSVIIDLINQTMEKYNDKVVLAMSEVREIINTIVTAIKG